MVANIKNMERLRKKQQKQPYSFDFPVMRKAINEADMQKGCTGLIAHIIPIMPQFYMPVKEIKKRAFTLHYIEKMRVYAETAVSHPLYFFPDSCWRRNTRICGGASRRMSISLVPRPLDTYRLVPLIS